MTGFADHWEHLRAEFALLEHTFEPAAPEHADDLAELRAAIEDRVAATDPGGGCRWRGSCAPCR
ncbi:hypothetical protein [Kineococcus rhizosphaerae]|uniref:Uncharacterized protein n=1 Tax=Kineococcus rhizosphaerae TaxID=559628 RepID=A0A2T0R5X5_9ACTN|nr:hypothetical protein [Kineococcus rhizosphaerae]PRY16574.1 hypothetical protein CLV37_1033 [Kineococcus rhizosphaerae]